MITNKIYNMSFNFGNSMSGFGTNSGFGNLHGNVQFHPTITTPSGATSITPMACRAGNLNSFSPKTGVNYGGIGVTHNPTPNVQVSAGVVTGSNGQTSAAAGVGVKF